MKKLLVILAGAIILSLFQINNFVLMTLEFNGSYTFYNNSPTENSVSIATTSNIWQAGWHSITSGNLEGKMVVFKGSDKDIDNFIKKLNIKRLSSQDISGVKIIYGYTQRLKGGVNADGQKINVQIARRGDTITIGSPLIFGSY